MFGFSFYDKTKSVLKRGFAYKPKLSKFQHLDKP